MKVEITYYKGILRSQFHTYSSKELGQGSKRILSQIQLEPTFELHNAEEISLEEYEKLHNQFLNIPHLKVDNNVVVEYSNNTDAIDSKRMNASHLLMGLEKEPNLVSINEIDWESLKLNNIPEKYLKDCFIAYVNGTNHGRISGPVILKRIKQFNDKEIEVFDGSRGDNSYLSNNKGCLDFSTGVLSYIQRFYLWIARLFHAISSRFLGFNNNMPNGSQNKGCLSFGCGLMSLLLSLAFLAWLIHFLFFGTNSSTKNQDNRYVEKIVHDTIYIQKNSKIDTVTYVDETTKTTVKMLSLPNVQFEKNKIVLLRSSIPQLNQLAAYLLENKSVNAEIIGHTDSDGNALANKKLSKGRAEQVRKYLIQNGVQSWRVKATGKGESEPVTENKTAEGRAMNRRVEVKLSNANSSKTTRSRQERKFEE